MAIFLEVSQIFGNTASNEAGSSLLHLPPWDLRRQAYTEPVGRRRFHPRHGSQQRPVYNIPYFPNTWPQVCFMGKIIIIILLLILLLLVVVVVQYCPAEELWFSAKLWAVKSKILEQNDQLHLHPPSISILRASAGFVKESTSPWLSFCRWPCSFTSFTELPLVLQSCRSWIEMTLELYLEWWWIGSCEKICVNIYLSIYPSIHPSIDPSLYLFS